MTKRKRGTLATVQPMDAPNALRASPTEVDIVSLDGLSPAPSEGDDFEPSEDEASGDKDEVLPVKKKSKAKNDDGLTSLERAQQRPPAVNSDYVPIPWKGRIGYACLNTYLRTSNPPVFCSRTCRIETVLKFGAWPKGLDHVRSLGLANAKDLIKLIRWNEKYGIKFLRISSEMFPFASHKEYGYSLEFAREPLEEAGRVAMELGHRLTVHPGQFTQIGSPRQEVVEASIRDLEYHSQLLRLLGLKGQADKDAVMILHMGGVYGDKESALERFEKNYNNLSDDIKARLVLENDDVSWSVHDLFPTCKKLNIPLVLDYHHHNIVHDPSIREGTRDVLQLLPEIAETWSCKGVTQKQHYSEPRDEAITDRDRRKHSARVRVLPPCPDNMDLMIEAKDKEQAVFELYRTYGIGGEGLFNEVVPHERTDENMSPKKQQKKKRQAEEEEVAPAKVPDVEVGMGGSERRVYWPLGKEDWLSPVKRTRKKETTEGGTETESATKKRQARKKSSKEEVVEEKVDPKPAKRGSELRKMAILSIDVHQEDGAIKLPRDKKRNPSPATPTEALTPTKLKRKRVAKAKGPKAQPSTKTASKAAKSKSISTSTTAPRRGRSAAKSTPAPVLTPRTSTPLSEPPEIDDEEASTGNQRKVFSKVDSVSSEA